jgi:small subunit ribosomal protein S6
MALYEHIYSGASGRDRAAGRSADRDAQDPHHLANGGSVSKVEAWGLKSLAFRIKKNRKAYFTLMNIDAPSAAIVELERQLSLNEDVIRYLTLRVDEHEAGPSAMLRKRDDERPRRSRRAAARVAIVATAATVPSAVPAVRATTPKPEHSDGHRAPPPRSSAAASPARSPAQARRRSTTRTREAAVALHLRARQDRALAHHRGLRPSKQRELAQAIKRARFLGLLPLRHPLRGLLSPPARNSRSRRARQKPPRSKNRAPPAAAARAAPGLRRCGRAGRRLVRT